MARRGLTRRHIRHNGGVADDDFPITALVPTDDRQPVIIHVDAFALRMAIVERLLQRHLPSSWETPGIYVLFESAGNGDQPAVYVGQSRNLRRRLQQHRGRERWSRALLIVRDTSHGFTTADIAYLEGRLHGELAAREGLRVGNAAPTGDETLPKYQRQQLDAALIPILSTLRLLGAAGTPSPRRRAKARAMPKAEGARPTRHDATMSDLLTAGLIAVGDALHSTGRKYPATARVLADGALDVDGERFASPSAAGMHVRDGRSTNGWTFWRTATGETLSALRTRL